MFAGVIERLDEAITAIADIDLDTLTDPDLDGFVIGLQRARHRLAGLTAAPLARWDTTSVWRSGRLPPRTMPDTVLVTPTDVMRDTLHFAPKSVIVGAAATLATIVELTTFHADPGGDMRAAAVCSDAALEERPAP
jgi:hypothetical protein